MYSRLHQVESPPLRQGEATWSERAQADLAQVYRIRTKATFLAAKTELVLRSNSELIRTLANSAGLIVTRRNMPRAKHLVNNSMETTVAFDVVLARCVVRLVSSRGGHRPKKL